MSATLEEIIDAILDGVVDNDMDKLNSAIKQRKEIKNSRKILFISVGDSVGFNSQANPKYLQGKVALVTKVNKSTVTVDMPEDYSLRKYSGSRGVRCPISIVDKIDDGN